MDTGWLVHFPLTDWAFYLLAGLNLGLGLYFSYLLAGLWLDGEKRVVAPFLLALIPFYNFIGLKWDQNSILIPLWALTTWAFVRSFETRHAGYAALAGAAAAAAMLTKYWSAFLIISIVIAALCDRRRGGYFRSAAPYVTALVGALLIAPHVLWLVQENFPPLQWVSTQRISKSLTDWLRSLSEYSFGTMGYAAVAVLTYAVLVRPPLAAARDILCPRDAARRMALIIFWLPMLVPIAVAKLNAGVENEASYVHAGAAAIEREWKAATDRSLEILAGPFALTSSIAFTLKDRPSTFAEFSPYLSPWVDAQALMRKGLAVICPLRDTSCVKSMDALAKSRPQAQQVEVELIPRWLGLTGTPDRFVIAIMPPR